MPPVEMTVDTTGKKINNVQVQDCLNELRLLVMADPCIIVRSDDLYLLRYLHSSNFNVNEAHKMIKIMNELRLEHTEWFCHSPPQNYSTFLSWNMKAMLKGRDKGGRRIYLTKVGRLDASKSSMQLMAQFDDLWFESVLDEPETQANGICCIVDMAGYSWKMFKWLTPRNVRIATKCVESLPVKRLVIHVINSSMLMNASVALVFPFMSAHFKENIHFHYQNWSSLHKFVDPEHLPEEYGGLKQITDFSEMNNWLLEQTPRLVENFKCDKRIN